MEHTNDQQSDKENDQTNPPAATNLKPEAITNDPLADAVWDHYQPVIDAAGKWRPEYSPVFAMLCDAFARWMEVTEKIRTDGGKLILLNPKRGTSYRNPLLDVQAQKSNEVHRLATAFGLTPIADAKIKAAPIDGLFKGGLFGHLLAGPPG